MTEPTNGVLPGARWLTAAEVRALFPGASWHEVVQQIADRRAEHGEDPDAAWVQFVEGDVAVDSFVAGALAWAIVVHGDLRATGDLDFATTDYETSLLVVRGSVHARNFRFASGAACEIAHELIVRELVSGRYGDESAYLAVGGALRARVLALDHATGCSAGTLDAIVHASPGWRLPIDIAEPSTAFDPALVDGPFLDHARLWPHVTAGRPILQPAAEPALRALVEARLR